ncbi:hypothetical protein Zmor_017004 [Zophobas morio]|uniref:Peptidase S1 domain-containing protein n=1 Tax=Zophobas morio TaxID=2755281 RepID=A0AA38I8V9_9CUCU|nr:hypothetical protein Zmor_017004 [Zophobas morio]
MKLFILQILLLFHHTLCKDEIVDYRVGLLIDGSKLCSGSLINENYILTAGRCIHRAFEVDVVIGTKNLLVQAKSSYISTTFMIRENRTHNLIYNDIALIKIPTLNSNYSINFPQLFEDEIVDGATLNLSGYNLENCDDLATWGEQQVEVNSDKCQNVVPCDTGKEFFFCATPTENTLSGFRNDGSALIDENDNLVGVALYNTEINATCAVKVSYFLPWIQSKIYN